MPQRGRQLYSLVGTQADSLADSLALLSQLKPKRYFKTSVTAERQINNRVSPHRRCHLTMLLQEDTCILKTVASFLDVAMGRQLFSCATCGSTGAPVRGAQRVLSFEL